MSRTLSPSQPRELRPMEKVGDLLYDRERVYPAFVFRGVSEGITNGGCVGMNETHSLVAPGACGPWNYEDAHQPARKLPNAPSILPGKLWPKNLTEMTLDELHQAVKDHLAGKRWPPSPFISVTASLDIACAFATGHLGTKTSKWITHDQSVNPGKIAMVDLSAVPEIWRRMVWIPDVDKGWFAGSARCEWLMWKTVDQDEFPLRWVSVSSVRLELWNSTWPQTEPAPHEVQQREIVEAWDFAVLFAGPSGTDAERIIVTVQELARHQARDKALIRDDWCRSTREYSHHDFTSQSAERIRQFLLDKCPNLRLPGAIVRARRMSPRLACMREARITQAVQGYPALYIVNHFIKWFGKMPMDGCPPGPTEDYMRLPDQTMKWERMDDDFELIPLKERVEDEILTASTIEVCIRSQWWWKSVDEPANLWCMRM